MNYNKWRCSLSSEAVSSFKPIATKSSPKWFCLGRTKQWPSPFSESCPWKINTDFPYEYYHRWITQSLRTALGLSESHSENKILQKTELSLCKRDGLCTSHKGNHCFCTLNIDVRDLPCQEPTCLAVYLENGSRLCENQGTKTKWFMQLLRWMKPPSEIAFCLVEL